MRVDALRRFLRARATSMPKHLTLVKKAAWMNAATRVVKVELAKS